jgi:class 3 adenylate cyclase/CheY-like chemotaxis protein
MTRARPLILVADDSEANRDILAMRLSASGYDVVQAVDGDDALAAAARERPDLILLDVMMPKLDGFAVCRRLKGDPALPFMPIILVTAKADTKDIVAGLDAGADEYLTKPIDQAALVARVRSILRLKALHDQVCRQAEQLSEQSAQLAAWNQSLEQRVEDQLGEIERVSRLKRFLPPQIAELVISSGNESVLASHRREITVVFCDLRGFTAFAETAEPEEVMAVLRDYHAGLGRIIHAFEGTLERFVGDGLMVLFNDPLPCPDSAARAVKMAIAMRSAVGAMAEGWARRGHDLGFGVGIAHGYATLGRIGFEGRFDYSAIGTVVNVAARLCGEAQRGQIVTDRRVAAMAADIATLEPLGELALKGLSRPVPAFAVSELK